MVAPATSRRLAFLVFMAASSSCSQPSKGSRVSDPSDPKTWPFAELAAPSQEAAWDMDPPLLDFGLSMGLREHSVRGVVVRRERVFRPKGGDHVITAWLENPATPSEPVRLDFGIDSEELAPIRVGDVITATRACSPAEDRDPAPPDCVNMLRDAAGKLLTMSAFDQKRPFLPEHEVRVAPRDSDGCSSVAIGREGSWGVFHPWSGRARRWEAAGAVWSIRASMCGGFSAFLVRVR